MDVLRSRPILTFTVAVLVLCGLVIVAGLGRDTTPFALVLAIPLAAILTAGITGAGGGIRGLLARTVRWRVPARWYLLAIGIPLAGTLLIDAAGIVTGQATLDELVGAVEASALIVPLVVFLPALFEELAWRGFGVEVMTERGHSFAVAALGIGLVFAAVHVPLYLPGQLYEDLPLWPVVPILLGYAVLLSWIYLGSGHSALLAAITHAALNGFVPLTHGLDDVWVWQARAVVFGLIGLVILGARVGRARMGRARMGRPRGD
jgi:uncharacterized protein